MGSRHDDTRDKQARERLDVTRVRDALADVRHWQEQLDLIEEEILHARRRLADTVGRAQVPPVTGDLVADPEHDAEQMIVAAQLAGALDGRPQLIGAELRTRLARHLPDTPETPSAGADEGSADADHDPGAVLQPATIEDVISALAELKELCETRDTTGAVESDRAQKELICLMFPSAVYELKPRGQLSGPDRPAHKDLRFNAEFEAERLLIAHATNSRTAS